MTDYSLTTFAAKGRLPQIQNAIVAVSKGQTSIGIKANNGVVLLTQKKLPSIVMDQTSVYKTQILTENIGAVYSGIGPDYRILCQSARKISYQYKVEYNQTIPILSLCRDLSYNVQQKTMVRNYRPFGVSILIAGYDQSGPHLYQIDPSGVYYQWKATAIGKNQKNIKVFLQKRYSNMFIQDAIHTALLTLKQGFEGEINCNNIELGVVKQDKKFNILTPSQIKDYMQEMQ